MARRMVLADRRRLAVSVAGVGAAIGLIFLLQGLWGGFQAQISAYPENAGAELFVGERGTRNLLGGTSVVPRETVDRIARLDGVTAADPLITRFAILDFDGHKRVAFLLGSAPGAAGGPWRLGSGRAARSDGEVVVDAVLAREHGLDLGDTLDVLGTPLQIVGLSQDTRSWMAGLVFVTHAAGERMFASPGTTSFVLVRTDDAQAVAERVGRNTGLAVLSATELAANDRDLLAGVMAAPLILMVAVAFAAGTLIVALTVYSGAVERLAEYGIVKAMGARRRWLAAVVTGQAGAVALLGTAAGYLMFRVGSAAVTALRPQFSIALPGRVAAAVIASAVVMALVAGLLPLRRVARLDPASVYRGGA